MTRSPGEKSPRGSFSDYMQDQQLNPHAKDVASVLELAGAVRSGYFNIKIVGTANGDDLGDLWLGKDSSDWAIQSRTPLMLEKYTWEGETYFKVPNEESYMSVSGQARDSTVGFYNWRGATTFRWEGEYLVSNYNGWTLSYNANTSGDYYLYCRNDYVALKAEEG